MKTLKPSIPPTMAWLLVFLPAFFYYMSTRLYSWGLFRSSTVGDMIEFTLGGASGRPRQEYYCSTLQSHVLATLDCTTHRGMGYRILQEPDIVATTWKHDEELGRGYLLLSTSLGQGKVWQWETGGGPIPIGKTLHLQDSGCRSLGKNNCTLGSGGLIVEPWQEPNRLIIAEWGERRIVRLEPTSGARTPLVIHHYNNEATTPIRQPRQLLLTAFGDLIVLDDAVLETENENGQVTETKALSASTVDQLWQLPQVTKIPPLLSLAQSRQAHSWTSTNHTIHLMLQQTKIGGVALVPKEWLKLYVTMTASSRVVLATLALGDNDDEDEPRQQSQILFDYTDYASQPGPIIVDNKGRLYLAVDNGILVVETPNKVLGRVTMTNVTDPIVSMTLGEDRFLYIATKDALYRLKTRNGPMEFPKNLVVKM